MTIDYAAEIARMQMESENAWTNLVCQSRATGAARFEKVQTGAGVGMIANKVTYAKTATVEEVLARKGDVAEIIATEDGRSFVNAWHEGESDIDTWVYFERYVDGARVSHGYLDPTSRRIVQTG